MGQHSQPGLHLSPAWAIPEVSTWYIEIISSPGYPYYNWFDGA